MLIGLVGKPNCGKSTFFKASTLVDVPIANYPFTTIKPNHGIAYVRVDCVCKEFGVKCNPQKGFCKDGKRFVPIELMDVAGLVRGASEGRGLGNQFLDDLTSADALIHIIDISGETDEEGKVTQGYNPINDVQMLENELDLWYLGILKKVWKTFGRAVQSSKEDFAKAIATQFSGLKVKEEDVKKVISKLAYNYEKPLEWTEEQLLGFARELRKISKKMVIAANKIDKASANANLENLKIAYPEKKVIPCSADFELALKEAAKANLIEYTPGDKEFKIKGQLNEKQKKALDNIKKVLEVYGSTGVQEVLEKVVFELLKYIAVFPVSNSKLTDSKGNILPDCFLVPEGSTILNLAYDIHTDLGEKFIKALHIKTKKMLSKEYVLKHRDVVEIISS